MFGIIFHEITATANQIHKNIYAAAAGKEGMMRAVKNIISMCE